MKGLKLKNDEKFYIDAPTCNNNEVLTWDGDNFQCTLSNGQAYTAGNSITINSNSSNNSRQYRKNN